MPPVAELGIGGVFAILVIQMVLNFLKSKKQSTLTPEVKLSAGLEAALGTMTTQMNQMNDIKEDIKTTIKHTEDLHQLLTVRDQDGVPLVYTKSSLERAIRDLTDTISKQSGVLDRMVDKFIQNDKDHEKMEIKIDKLLRNTAH